VPHLCRFCPGICLTTRKKHGKTSVRVVRHKHTMRIHSHNNNIFAFLIIFGNIHENNVLLGHKMMCSFCYYGNKILHYSVKEVYCLNLEYLGWGGL